MLWTYSKVILEHFLNFGCSLNCNACFAWHVNCNACFAWHSIITQVWKLLKACRKCIFSEYLYTLHVCKHLFWVWQVVFWVWQILLMWRRKKGNKKKWWAILVMFTWIDWNLTWKFNQSSVFMQNNDNLSSFYSAKKPTQHRSVVGWLSSVSRSPGTQGMSSVAGNEKLLWFSRRNFICTSPGEAFKLPFFFPSLFSKSFHGDGSHFALIQPLLLTGH